MNELMRAIVDDLCLKLTALILLPRTEGDEPPEVAAAKKAVTQAREALAVAGYYAK